MKGKNLLSFTQTVWWHWGHSKRHPRTSGPSSKNWTACIWEEHFLQWFSCNNRNNVLFCMMVLVVEYLKQDKFSWIINYEREILSTNNVAIKCNIPQLEQMDKECPLWGLYFSKLLLHARTTNPPLHHTFLWSGLLLISLLWKCWYMAQGKWLHSHTHGLGTCHAKGKPWHLICKR